MRRIRVIPVLQYLNQGLVKTIGFKKPQYIGDPVNAVKIFNEKEVDELAFIDISASISGKEPDYRKIEEIASECFMPLAYGGGITTVSQIKKILNLGVEKIIVNTSAATNLKLISDSAEKFGSQSIVVSIDVRKNIWGRYDAYYSSGGKKIGMPAVEFAKNMQQHGCGELIVNSIDRDGSYKGYDTTLIKSISSNLDIPVIALGGAGKLEDFKNAIIQGGASAVAAGSMFVFHGPHKAVLINYPTQQKLTEELYSKI